MVTKTSGVSTNDNNGWQNPGMNEQCGDGVDNNCDGDAEEDCGGIEPTDTGFGGPGCACSSNGSPVPALWLLPLGLVALRRRTGSQEVN